MADRPKLSDLIEYLEQEELLEVQEEPKLILGYYDRVPFTSLEELEALVELFFDKDKAVWN